MLTKISSLTVLPDSREEIRHHAALSTSLTLAHYLLKPAVLFKSGLLIEVTLRVKLTVATGEVMRVVCPLDIEVMSATGVVVVGLVLVILVVTRGVVAVDALLAWEVEAVVEETVLPTVVVPVC